jgi:O-antigen ligase
LLILAGATLLAVLIQLIPLPSGLWSSLSGREPVVAAYEATGLALPALPLTLTPAATWNAAFALLTPITALLLGLTLDAPGRLIMLRLLIALGLLSGFIGLMQAVGGVDSALYFYRHTNEGYAVGLFANRNHQALLLAAMFPMLAAHAALVSAARTNQARFVWPMTYVICGFLVPLLLVTGSRAGLVFGVVGLLAALWIKAAAPRRSRRPAPVDKRRAWLFGGFGVAIFAGLIAITMSRATAVQRLLAGGEDELRLEVLPIIWRAAIDFFPWGSGYGSFSDVYRIYEPATMLGPNYLNHAHNDFAELLMTGGLPAALLLLAGIAMMAIALWRTVRLAVSDGDQAVFARMSAAIAVMLVLGSIADYPLRAPSLALVAAITVAIWARALSGHRRIASGKVLPPAAGLPGSAATASLAG